MLLYLIYGNSWKQELTKLYQVARDQTGYPTMYKQISDRGKQ